jgi:hypothetical protein
VMVVNPSVPAKTGVKARAALLSRQTISAISLEIFQSV